MYHCTWKIIIGKYKTAQEEQGQDQDRYGWDVFPVIEILECNMHPEEAEVNKPGDTALKEFPLW